MILDNKFLLLKRDGGAGAHKIQLDSNVVLLPNGPMVSERLDRNAR
jgi:hypothetical protein